MQAVDTPDKIIVDRRRSTRNSELRRALRSTRDKLALQGSPDADFERELLVHHANAVIASIVAVPLLIILTAFAAFSAGFDTRIIVWALVASMLYVSMGVLSKRYLARQETADPSGWRVAFLLAHGITGFSWTYFAVSTCDNCGSDTALMFQTSALLIAIAATATICSAIRFSIVASFAIPVSVFATLQIGGTTTAMIAAGMLFSALLFFAFIAERLHKASIASIAYRAENTALIAELEMAKSISDEARRRAEDANLAKSRFLASMSHELRTPLNAILGFSEAMKGEMLGPIGNESYKGYVADIHASGRHLLELINEILDLSRIEAGRYELREEALRLANVAEDCIGLVRIKAKQKDITITPRFQEGLPRMLADEKALRQILLNMLSNAVKFTPAGGHVDVKVGWTASGGQYVSVTDNGPGIPEDEIPIVLSAFGQGSIAIKNAEQGTGLGLPIVQALLAMHGGTFTLKSRLREGTEATALFPAARTLEVLPAQPIQETPDRGSGRRAVRAKQVA